MDLGVEPEELVWVLGVSVLQGTLRGMSSRGVRLFEYRE